mgnify:CR=1 FL=1
MSSYIFNSTHDGGFGGGGMSHYTGGNATFDWNTLAGEEVHLKSTVMAQRLMVIADLENVEFPSVYRYNYLSKNMKTIKVNMHCTNIIDFRVRRTGRAII